MSWPTPQEYNEAIQNPDFSFSDPDLKSGQVALTPIGIPKAMTGAFASVYKLSTKDTDWAIRCFLNHRPEQKERYEKISKHVLMDNLEYTVEFHYLEEGIKVRGHWYPILKMNWIHGPTFESYLLDNYRNSNKVKNLKEEFARLAKGLDDAGMAHGDLQHGNIIVSDERLRLIDYDAIFVPDLLGKLSLEVGHPNYQHPLRTEHNYDTTADNFSCWLIYNSLSIIEIEPKLFDQFSGGDECILFRQKDFLEPESSPVFNTLLNHDSEEIRNLTTTIVRMLWARPEMVPELHHPEELELLPKVKPKVEEIAHKFDEFYCQTKDSKESSDTIGDGTRFHQDQNLRTFDLTPEDHPKDKTTSKYAIFNTIKTKALEFSDKQLKYWSPYSWIEKTITKGDKFANQGNFHRAAHFYLLAFKQANKNADSDFAREILIEVCAKLGNALIEAKNVNLATNYLYIAYKTAKGLKDSDPERVGVTAFLLAAANYLKDDEEDAYYLFKNQENLLTHLFSAILKKPYNSFIFRPEILVMLLNTEEILELERFTDEFDRIAKVCLKLYEILKSRTSTKLDRRCISLYMYRMESLKQTDQSAPIYETCKTALEAVKSVLDKEGLDYNDFEYNAEYVEKLLKLAKLESLLEDYPDFVSFWQKILNLKHLDEEEFFNDIIDELESIKEAEIFQCLHSCLSGMETGTFNFSTPLRLAYEERASATYNALIKALIVFGTNEEIAEQWIFLSKVSDSEAPDNFKSTLFNALSYERIIEVLKVIPQDCYIGAISEINLPILSKGSIHDVKRHILMLGGETCTIEAANFSFEVLKIKNKEFLLKLIFELVHSNCRALCKLLYLKNSVQLEEAYRTIFVESDEIKDICQLSDVFLNLYGEDELHKFLFELIESREYKFRIELLKEAAPKSLKSIEHVILCTFQASPATEQKELVSWMVSNRYFDTIESLFYNLAERREFFDLEDLTLQISWAHNVNTAKSPLPHIYVSEYFATIGQVAKNMANGNKSFTREIWNNQISSALEQKYGNRVREK